MAVNITKKVELLSKVFTHVDHRKATMVILDLIDQAIHSKLQASHVLFDTWFCSLLLFIAVKKRGLDV